MPSGPQKKDFIIDILLVVGTIGATFIFGVFALPHVQVPPSGFPLLPF